MDGSRLGLQTAVGWVGDLEWRMWQILGMWLVVVGW